MPASRVCAVFFLALSLGLPGPAAGVAETLAIVGATVIDVSEFGAGTSDLDDAVVVIENGIITAVGPRPAVEIPANAKVVRADGRYIVPGLTDGFAALNKDLFGRLEQHPAFALHRTPGGSNVFVLDVKGTDPNAFHERMAAAGVSMREPRDDGSIIVQVNETWASQTGEELGRRMVAALG
jgi:hypothetical protein